MTGESIRFQIPKQDLARPTACPATPGELDAWLETLPKANIGETAKNLYQYTSELSRVAVSPATRMQLAEHLRPLIRYANRALERHYLNQPVVLPPQSRKVAQLAQTLQGLLAKQYVIICAQCATQAVSQPELAGLIPQAVQRAMSELGQVILRSCQLYMPPPVRTWHELHQLFLLAEQRALLDCEVYDPEHPAGARQLGSTYLQALLLGCSKTNQLRQADIAPLYNALSHLAASAQLARGASTAVLCVDPRQDFPACYTTLLKGNWDAGCLGLNTSHLLEKLHQSHENLPEGLREHLDRALGAPQKRHFTRIRTDNTVEVCVGLTAVHFMLAGELSFDAFLQRAQQQGRAVHAFHGTTAKHPTQAKKDVWDQIYKPGNSILDQIDYSLDMPGKAAAGGSSAADNKQGMSQQVKMLNASAGGCCLRWEENVPPQIKAGEIVGLRHEGHTQWNIAVIRWLSAQEASGTLLGVELLSPGGTPVAARVFNKTGEHGDYMRGIELPPLPLVGQPATLLLPRVPFRERQKILLLEHDKPVQGQLLSKIAGTSAVAQFSFELSKPNNMHQHREPGHEGFDAIWDKL